MATITKKTATKKVVAKKTTAKKIALVGTKTIKKKELTDAQKFALLRKQGFFVIDTAPAAKALGITKKMAEREEKISCSPFDLNKYLQKISTFTQRTSQIKKK